MSNPPGVALGAGFIGAPSNKLLTVDQKPNTDPEMPAVVEKKWMKKAIDPEHEGACTPMSKKTCTPRRKALARRFKKGGDLHPSD